MPWKETNPVNERVKFIAAYLSNEDDFTDLCDWFGISRKTGYKWVERYESNGVEGLREYSRAPHTHPNALDDKVVEAILSARKRHPTWGPRKLLVILKRQQPKIPLPVASTVGEILRRNGFIKKRRRRIRSSPYGKELRTYDGPNAVWCADFKGHFPVNGKRCHPLTISDGYSRYLIRCKALPRPLSQPTLQVFESAFREFGMPEAIRTDNGPPFSTLAAGGLSRLAVWWIRLGIRPERILPGRPDQNGRHERMHRTLKAETTKPPRNSFPAQQRAFDQFRQEYNHVRPHEALDQNVPASRYLSSLKSYPQRLPEPEYPEHFYLQRTYPNGMISFNSTRCYISVCLQEELIGLEEVDDDRWRVYFGPVALGLLDLQNVRKRGYRQVSQLVRLDGEITSNQRRRRKKIKVKV